MLAATMLQVANHPAPPLAASESEAETLWAMTRAGTTEQRMALRAKIILRAAEGVANVAIADDRTGRPADLRPGDKRAGPGRHPDATRGDPLEHPRAGQGRSA